MMVWEMRDGGAGSLVCPGSLLTMETVCIT